MAPFLKDELWTQAINRMLRCLKTDLSNHRMLADPWERAACCMISTWNNILRRGKVHRLRAPKLIDTWDRAAILMRRALLDRVRQRMVRTPWLRWAGDRAQMAKRWPRKFAAAAADCRTAS